MQRLLVYLALCSALLVAALAAAPAAAQEPPKRCFPEADYCITDKFLEYWESHGGEEVFGRPTSEVRTETLEDGSNTWTGPVQWFQRDRLENHTVEGRGVLAGRLGALLLKLKGTPWEKAPPLERAAPGCRYFAETHHSLCPPFLGYWEAKGGVERFGFPITEQFNETTDNGWSGTVQYFERRRMEHHAEDSQMPVQLGLLGDEVRKILTSTVPPVNALVAGPKPSDTDYTFEISIDSADQATIKNVDVFIYDPNNQEAYHQTFPYQPGNSLTVNISKDQLKTGGEYTIKVFAKDKDNKFIPTKDGKEELATQKFGHTIEAPPKPPTAEVSVGPIEREATQDFLPVRVLIKDESKQLEANRDFINSTVRIYHNGPEIHTYPFRGLDLANPLIRVPLERDQLKGDQDYEVAVEIVVPGLQPVISPRLKFRPVLPTPPTFWQKYVEPVVRSPVTVGGIIFVIALVAIVLMYTSRPKRQGIPPPVQSNTMLAETPSRDKPAPRKPEPQESGATMLEEAQSQPRLKLLVVQTIDPAQRGAELVTGFPCVLGRVDADLSIPGDKKVSRRHAEIFVQDGKIMIKDLNSVNGTSFLVRDPKGDNGSFSVKMRLERGASAEWDGSSLIGLGRNTVILLEPIPGQQPGGNATILDSNAGNETIFGG